MIPLTGFRYSVAGQRAHDAVMVFFDSDHRPVCEIAPDSWFESSAPDWVVEACLSCPARTECLEYSIVADERWGTYGGIDERTRRKLIKGGISNNGSVA